jgi:SAM-dependent methyltransferase
MNLVSPITRTSLNIDEGKSQYISPSKDETFPLFNGKVISFLPSPDTFYEGAYLNRVKYVPKSEKWYHVWPLWLISNGYLWEVRKQIAAGSVVLELGCASGVDYFGQRYQMIGLDLSLRSLEGLHNYAYAIQADATQLPLANESVDAIISSYFWEHIPPNVKDIMLAEFSRVLKPKGKIVFLYDVETQNSLIELLKSKDKALYNRLFLDGDGHLGYETPLANKARFEQYGFAVMRHFGMERTWVQSPSVYEKLRHVGGLSAVVGQALFRLSSIRILNLAYTAFVRAVDISIGRLFHGDKSRILLSVLQKL